MSTNLVCIQIIQGSELDEFVTTVISTVDYRK